jgi:hypothetical protein
MPGAVWRRGASLAIVLGLAGAPRALLADIPAPARPPQPVASPAPAVDPAAVAALRKMGAFLHSLQAMWVQGETTTDDVLPSGQKIEYSGTVDVKVRQPNRLRVEVTSDRKNEQMFYDGATFTVFQPTPGYFASFAAPPTVRGLVDVLERRYGADLPLADLFRLGSDETELGSITSATMVGWSTIKGTVCAHYAFRQPDVDWELWIQEGPQPLPRKLVITTSSEKTEPQHAAVLSWNLTPRLDEQMFTFKPPPRAQRIDFAGVGPGPGAGAPQGPMPGGTP